MSKFLVIVESPAKARTINRYLGDDYVVVSSKGHIRDLPASGGQRSKRKAKKTASMPAVTKEDRAAKAQHQLIQRLGVDPDNGWQANYEILWDKEDVVAGLRLAARRADTIFLATDMDREGEAIAWHIQEIIGGDPARYRRVIFNEITHQAIASAFAEPVTLDMNRVNAQQARRFLDRVVGYMLSPLLWSKVARGLSAGRVQSVAVRLIVEREREIFAFVPKEYWTLTAHLSPPVQGDRPAADAQDDAPLPFAVVEYKGKKFQPTSETTSQQAVTALNDASFVVAACERKADKKRKPSPPFITSTLQQAASTQLGLSVKRAMVLAQRLYEAGHITYMRTDSTNLSTNAVDAARKLILNSFSKAYLPPKPVFYRSSKRAQEAHEAIRPANVEHRPEQLTGVEPAAVKLYELIWRQFVACQMLPAEYDLTAITVTAGDYLLRIRGREQRFDGYMRVKPAAKKAEDRALPLLPVNAPLRLVSLKPEQHFTKPPGRYREASLVQMLEKQGIGRPSTYASIISTIQERGYVSLQKKQFYAEQIGKLVTDRLLGSFPNLMDYAFTAGLEEKLDQVAGGDRQWQATLDDFYSDFSLRLATAKQADQGMPENVPTPTDIACPDCGRKLVVRTASTGVFLGCEGYTLPPKDQCTRTINLLVDFDAADLERDDEGESKLLRTRHKCPICETPMHRYAIDDQRRLHICAKNPDCNGFEVETGNFKTQSYAGATLDCDKCTSQMQLESGRFGKYFKCTNKDCSNTRKLLRNGQPASPKMSPVAMPELKCRKVDDHYVLRDGEAGVFLAASQFPRHRETRPPLVRELLPHQNEIDPKYAFLLQAPTEDPKGNPTTIRFMRKTKEHYVLSEKDDKRTGWSAQYKNGQWQESTALKASAKPRKKAAKTKKTAGTKTKKT